MFLVLVFGIVLWLLYGLLSGDGPLIACNAITLVLAGAILFMFLLNPANGLVDQLLGFVGIHGPRWFFDPAWAKAATSSPRSATRVRVSIPNLCHSFSNGLHKPIHQRSVSTAVLDSAWPSSATLSNHTAGR